MTWFLWALLLLAQQTTSTWSSRAKAQQSSRKVAWAGVFSHGVWICSQFMIVGTVASALEARSIGRAVFTVVFYTFFCTAGNALAHWYLVRRERGL